jgi:plasmid stabilization system protein ParE
MPHPVEVLAEAVDELIDAKLWYDQRDSDAAIRFALAIDAAIDSISNNPTRWPSTRKNARRFVLRDFPFAVVYTFENSTVRIVAIAHARRRPGYWEDRT